MILTDGAWPTLETTSHYWNFIFRIDHYSETEMAIDLAIHQFMCRPLKNQSPTVAESNE